MCSSSTPAAATPRCRRWSAARSTMPPPRWTLPSRPTPMSARTSGASRSPGAFRCSPSSPRRRPPSQIRSIKDLEGRTVGVSALGNADHALTLYLLQQAGADAEKGPVRHHGRQPAGSVAPGPDRRRPGAGAGADIAAALGRARPRERHGPRGRQALSRRIL